MLDGFEQRLSGAYQDLSTKLRQAADHVAANPIDVATRSLRSISKDADLSPATFSRMSRALGYESYEDLREVMRSVVGKPRNSFANRVATLQQAHGEGGQDFLSEHFVACANNLHEMSETIDAVALETAVDRLHSARQVLVAGALGSTGIAEYLNYMASFIATNWYMATQMGASLASGLVGLTNKDAIIIITKPPFARQSIMAAKEAKANGAFVMVITDTHTCPALANADAGFLIPTDSPHFFSSYAATIVLTETIIGMLASRSGESARERIAKVEDRNRSLGEVWDG